MEQHNPQELEPEVLLAAPNSESAFESSHQTKVDGAHRALKIEPDDSSPSKSFSHFYQDF